MIADDPAASFKTYQGRVLPGVLRGGRKGSGGWGMAGGGGGGGSSAWYWGKRLARP